MKRILSLILIFLLVFTLYSCNDLQQNERIDTDNTEESYTINQKRLSQMRTHIPVDLRGGGWQPPMFEKRLESVTHVIQARCIGRSTFCREVTNIKAYLEYMYEFEVTKCYRGSNVPIRFFVPDKFRESDSTYNIEYKAGQNYLLLLQDSYNEMSHSLEFVENSLILPMDDNGKVDISKSLIYECPIEMYMKTDEAKQALEDGNLLTYILNAVKDNPEVIKNRDFIESDDFFEIYDATSYVALVHIEEPRELPRNTVGYDYGKEYSCEVLTWIKGESEDETIEITLPLSKIEKTGNYVLLLAPNDHGNVRKWYLSGYQSVYSEDEVAEFLKN